jgi:hypothetical protein
VVANGVSINPALALHSVIRSLVNSDQQNVQNAWHDVLGVPPGTVPFIERHTEIVGLVGVITQRLNGLPETAWQKELYLGYVPGWYDAVVSRNPWGVTQHPPSSLLSGDSLNMLATLGTFFDYEFGDRESVLTGDAMQRLRDGLAEWRDLLDESGLPEALANEIRRQVDHLEWLLDNVNLVGNQPIVHRAEELVGTSVRVMAARPNLAVRLNAALLGVVSFLTLAHTGIDEANGVLEGVKTMTATVQEIAGGDVAPKELPAGPHVVPDVPSQNASEVLEGEIVDDEAAG